MVATLLRGLIRVPVLAGTVSVPTGAAPVTHQDQGVGWSLSRRYQPAPGSFTAPENRRYPAVSTCLNGGRLLLTVIPPVIPEGPSRRVSRFTPTSVMTVRWVHRRAVPLPPWFTAEAYPLTQLGRRQPGCGGADGQSGLVVISQPPCQLTRSAKPITRSSKSSCHIERYLVPQHIVAGARQLMRHRLARYYRIRLSAFALIEPLHRRVITNRKIRRLHKCPGQILVAVLGVPLPLAFAIT